MLLDIIDPPLEMQYGGGLDDAYMNRRTSNAFADPDANTAFASPISQGGLPTIYREAGGGAYYSDDQGSAAEAYNQMAAEEEAAAYGFDEFDQADADAGAAGRYTPEGQDPIDDYISYDSRGRAIQTGSPADEALNIINIRNAATLGADRYRDRFDTLGKIDPDSKYSNLQLMQKGIDRDAYNKAGIPLANFLEEKGLATFGKGMRGPFESYTPGGGLYRWADDKRSEEIEGSDKRGVYGEVGFEESSPVFKEFEMRMRYAKPGETIADITDQLRVEGNLSVKDINSAAQAFGYSPNSSAQASQVYESLNDARGSGILQGLGLIAGGIVSPGGFVNSILSSYGDRGETTTPVGTMTDQVLDATGIRSLADQVGLDRDNKYLNTVGKVYDFAQRGPGALVDSLDPSRRGVPSDTRDMTDVVNPEINQDLVNLYNSFKVDNERTGDVRSSRRGTERSGTREKMESDFAQLINKPSKERGQMEYQSERRKPQTKEKSINLREAPAATKEVPQSRLTKAPTAAQKAPEEASTNSVKEIVTSLMDAGGNLVSGVVEGISDFFGSIFGEGGEAVVSGEPTGLGPNEPTGLRQLQKKPTNQQVAAIVTEVAKTPEKVQQTLLAKGLLYQYLALIQAGYKADEAMQAVGAEAGTPLGASAETVLV